MSQSDNDALIQAYGEYLEFSKGRARGTVDGYLAHLVRLTRYLGDRNKALQEATAEDLEQFTGLHLHELGVRPRSRRPAIAAVRGFYAWVERKGLVDTNPATGLAYPQIGRKLPETMPLRAVEAMLMCTDLDTFLGVRDAAIIALLAGSGLRISGLVNLNEGDLVREVDKDGREEAFVRATEKGGHDRLVPLPSEALLLIRAYLGHPDLARMERTLANGDRVLFCNTRNPRKQEHDNCGESRRLTPRSIRRLLMKYGRLANVPEKFCHPHAFRHLYATELVESETDLATVQQLMGHKTLESSKVYIHLAMRRLRKAVDGGNPLGKIETPVSGLVRNLGY